MIRAFIAVPLPVTLQRILEDVRVQCQQLPVTWRWVPPSQQHLTVKFLGDVPPDRIDTVVQAMAQTVTGQTSFVLAARALGCFPHPARPRILWMGLDDAKGALQALFQRLETALETRGFPLEERPLRPHVTLARIRQAPRGDPLRTLLHAYHDHCFGECPVVALHLFQSQLQREGAVYIRLHAAALSPTTSVETGQDGEGHG